MVINPMVRTGVPLFFMMSGYLLLRNPKTLQFGLFYRRRFGRILIPFLIWDAIYFADKRRLAGLSLFSTDFFKELFVNGSEYHLWYVYTLIGLYLFMPFLKRIVDACTLREDLWLLALTLFAPTLRPFFNTVTPFYVFLFDPLLEGYIGFVLLGYILGSAEISKRARVLIYLGGIAGLLICAVGNITACTPEVISLPFNGGYQINHYLCASAVFVFAKYLPELKNRKLAAGISTFAGVTYGMYLCHVLIHHMVMEQIEDVFTYKMAEIGVAFFFTVMISSVLMLLLSKVKYVNRLLL